MGNSRITLWKAPELKKEKRMLVEDIDTYYLKNSLTHVTDESAVYVRHELTKELKMTMSEAKQLDMSYNYCTIDNYTVVNNVKTYESRVYYWIDNLEVLNINTIRLLLSMDVINTLGQGALAVGNPQNFTAKSQIYREHQDRFFKPYGYDIESTTELIRKIDKFDEGLSVNLYKQNETIIEKDDPVKNWYVLYKTSNTLDPSDIDNPIDIYIIPDRQINVAYATEGNVVEITPSDLLSGKYYYMVLGQNTDGQIQFTASDSYMDFNIYRLGTNNMIISANTGLLPRTGKIIYVYWYLNGASIKYGYGIETSDHSVYYADEKDCQKIDIITGNKILQLASKVLTSQAAIVTAAENQTVITASATISTINSIVNVDRTDSQNMKLIMLPYCPVVYDYDSINNQYTFGSQVDVGLNQLKVTDYTQPFSSGDDASLEVDLSKLIFNIQSQPDMFESASQGTESKLYSSQFMLLKLLYDSFSTEIKLDRFIFHDNLTVDSSYDKLVLYYKASNTMSGNFGFKWKPANQDETYKVTYKDSDDYPNLLLITRNNELSLFNNDYVNYIRAGYNYDKKAQALGAVSGILSTAMQGASAIASGNPFGMASAIGNAAQTVLGIVQSENNMQARLAQLSAQATKVNGSNDVDLMQWYSDNKLKLVSYEPDSHIKVDIWKKLMYNGYVHRVEEKPNVTSRIWYNYLECTPAYSSEGLKIARRDWLEQLTSLYEQGVTVYHWQNENPETVVYDFDRQYENWESWIFEE